MRIRNVIAPRRFRALSTMTIYKLLRTTRFGPEDIERLVAAYEETLRALNLKDRSDPITSPPARIEAQA